MSIYNVVTTDLNDVKTQHAWNAFVSRHQEEGHHHLSGYLQAIKKAFNHDLICLMATDRSSGEVKGVLPLIGIRSFLFGDKLTSIPFYNYGGPLYDSFGACEALVNEAKLIRIKRRYQSLELRCMKDHSNQGGLSVETHKACLVLALPDAINKIGVGNAKKRSKLRSQCKLAERKAKEMGVPLEQKFGTNDVLFNDFYSVFAKRMHALGTPVYGKHFFQSILDNTPSTITVVYWNGKPVSCGWLFDHGDRISIPWASTLNEVNRYAINSHMYYNILSRCIDEGRKLFDFGRSTIDAGTYKFKLQWGAEPQQCYWHKSSDLLKAEDRQPQDTFSLAVKCWKKIPLSVANLIGPFIIKSIAA
ncbi:GNAT family N-acetyltransferase [Alteromonas sp. 14N.309.X.WAT.G.H12]|uniref:GNAT family N-acetyltransferase n=1 Tax=Alteromonas sp. 14N.309.X.WAT.G.H12 TaxID=3120824 RepID=UPI002FD04FB1